MKELNPVSNDFEKVEIFFKRLETLSQGRKFATILAKTKKKREIKIV